MFRYFFKTIQGKIVGLFIIFMTLTFAASYYSVQYMSQNAIEKEKAAKLLHVAIYQERLLGARDYDAILAEAGAQAAPREEKIAVLNRALAERTDEVASLFPELGVGYYSLELDAMLTYGPSNKYGDMVGGSIAQNHPGRTVMRENAAMVRTGSMVRGHIMNAMQPITRNGKIIGYVWANELTSNIEREYLEFSDNVIVFFAVFYLASLFIAIALSRRMVRNLDTIVAGVNNMRSNLAARIENVGGELGEVANNINSMAEDLEKNAEEHDALLRAEAANMAQRDFLSRMSHEMRTPMNAVIGMANIARKTDDAGKVQDCLKKISDAASHLLGVINDVLDMAKIEAGKLELSETVFSLRKMLRQVVTVSSFKIEENQQNFTLEIGGDVPDHVLADSQRLAQVITNLLSNANKFTPAGGSIGLRVNRLEPPDDASGSAARQEAGPGVIHRDGLCRLRFEVRDTGIGIAKEQQARLFNSFEQADSSISRKYGGTGLGLAISKRIIEMMNGRAWIESEIGHGASFIFEVNLRVSAVQPEAAPPVTEKPVRGIFSGKRILLAEDVPVNREIVLALLEPTQAVIDCVENGAEAVRIFSAEPEKYDLILMDVQMPEMDGYEATQRIRASASARAGSMPIIAMTANVFQSDVDKCLAAGMNGHVGKPLDFDEVLEKLRHYLP